MIMSKCFNNTPFFWQMFTDLLKHMPPPASNAAASSSASEQNSYPQTTVPAFPLGHLVAGPKDQRRLLTHVGSTATCNHYAMTGANAIKHSGGTPRTPSSLSWDNGRGRVKKKRKKKDKREWDKAEGEVGEWESSTPKKLKEEKDSMVATLKKSKESKRAKEQRESSSKGKEGRKGSGAELKNMALGTEAIAAVVCRPAKVPGKRGRKPKVKVLPPVSTNEGIVLMVGM